MPQHTPEAAAAAAQGLPEPQQQVQAQPQQSDLGQNLAQPQPVGPSPSFRNSVNQFFQDPVNRAGLLSFGLNMLSGGFGTPLQQFASSVGAGVESAAGAEKFQTQQARLDEEQEFRERGLAQRGQIAREAQEGQTERALITARSRIQAAGLGGTSLANKLMSGFTATRLAALKRMENVLDPNHGKSPEEQGRLATQEATQGMQQAIEFTREQVPGTNFGGQFPGGTNQPNFLGGPSPAQPPQGGAQATPTSAKLPTQPQPGQQGGGGFFSSQFQGKRTKIADLNQNSPNFQKAIQLDQTPEGKLQLWRGGIEPSPPFVPPLDPAAQARGGQVPGTPNALEALRRARAQRGQ